MRDNGWGRSVARSAIAHVQDSGLVHRVKIILKSGERRESEAHTESNVVRKMSSSDRATDRPASVVEK